MVEEAAADETRALTDVPRPDEAAQAEGNPQMILDNQSGFDLYRSHDGENWVPVTTNGMDNPYNMGLRTMVSSPAGLFLGTANPFGPKVMPLGGDRYVPNPRGGCEVHFAPRARG